MAGTQDRWTTVTFCEIIVTPSWFRGWFRVPGLVLLSPPSVAFTKLLWFRHSSVKSSWFRKNKNVLSGWPF